MSRIFEFKDYIQYMNADLYLRSVEVIAIIELYLNLSSIELMHANLSVVSY